LIFASKAAKKLNKSKVNGTNVHLYRGKKSVPLPTENTAVSYEFIREYKIVNSFLLVNKDYLSKWLVLVSKLVQ
jgi:hypothetical protein